MSGCTDTRTFSRHPSTNCQLRLQQQQQYRQDPSQQQLYPPQKLVVDLETQQQCGKRSYPEVLLDSPKKRPAAAARAHTTSHAFAATKEGEAEATTPAPTLEAEAANRAALHGLATGEIPESVIAAAPPAVDAFVATASVMGDNCLGLYLRAEAPAGADIAGRFDSAADASVVGRAADASYVAGGVSGGSDAAALADSGTHGVALRAAATATANSAEAHGVKDEADEVECGEVTIAAADAAGAAARTLRAVDADAACLHAKEAALPGSAPDVAAEENKTPVEVIELGSSDDEWVDLWQRPRRRAAAAAAAALTALAEAEEDGLSGASPGAASSDAAPYHPHVSLTKQRDLLGGTAPRRIAICTERSIVDAHGTQRLPVNLSRLPLFMSERDRSEAAAFITDSLQQHSLATPLLSSESMALLRVNRQLNDEVINFFFSLLQRRNDEALARGDAVPKCHFFNSFFDERLKVASYEGVRRWTKRVDLFAHDLLLLPVHHKEQQHWALGVVDFRPGCRRLRIYDSGFAGALWRDWFERMGAYLEEEHKHKRGRWYFPDGDCVVGHGGPLTEAFRVNRRRHAERDSPQQQTLDDCGVFVCLMAEALSDQREFDFPATKTKECRLMLAFFVLKELQRLRHQGAQPGP
ncbi:ulp1 protease C-terminal catalytic domain-containing protein [Cyclospora cayetanensis]|uniref:Ulp1 protease C-terminal catalytic domain-containing protein n=1 Tax=Cyclospora cayetanensis TaxID=88456 RepID=A0A1D3CZ40_9EIME|nr:ulp1 protease C-terminal catalytic domain-containing protein [Cyclospora cayetanensis]